MRYDILGQRITSMLVETIYPESALYKSIVDNMSLSETFIAFAREHSIRCRFTMYFESIVIEYPSKQVKLMTYMRFS